MISSTVFAILAVLPLLSAAAPARATVFGVDQRREAILGDARARSLAKATALMVSPVYLAKSASGQNKLDLDFPTLSANADVCTDQPFAMQPVSPVTCTGFLIAPDLLLTAGHCAVHFGETADEATPFCTSFHWLFDYQADAAGKVQTKEVASSRFVPCKKILYAIHEYDYDGNTDFYTFKRDFAIVQLERPVLDREPIQLAKEDAKLGELLDMVGYPAGLPVKHTGSSSVTDASHVNFVRANLDSFAGNSGSPVFASGSRAVSGILVRTFPDADFAPAQAPRTCQVSNTCDEDGKNCAVPQANTRYPMGAHVQRISDVLAALRARKIPINISR